MAPRAKDNLESSLDFNLNLVYGCRKVDPEGGYKNCYIDMVGDLKDRTNLPDPFIRAAKVFISTNLKLAQVEICFLPVGAGSARHLQDPNCV